jgi:hypothetical protein
MTEVSVGFYGHLFPEANLHFQFGSRFTLKLELEIVATTCPPPVRMVVFEISATYTDF